MCTTEPTTTRRCERCRGTGWISFGWTSDGDRDQDACNEPGCTAYADLLARTKRCEAAKAPLRAGGYEVSGSRDSLIVSSRDATWQMKPVRGGWEVIPTRGEDRFAMTAACGLLEAL
jgi:hypothetical protein